MSLFSAYLHNIKQEFPGPRALLVRDDKTLRRYVLAWSPALVRIWTTEPIGEDIGNLWECVHVDHKALGDLTGDSVPDVLAALRRLQGLELIYPDGTVPTAVTRVLTKEFNFASRED